MNTSLRCVAYCALALLVHACSGSQPQSDMFDVDAETPAAETVQPDICQPDCQTAVCGPDGCGGACGSCEDSLFCTLDSCGDGQCSFELQPFFCVIDGICVPDGADNPEDTCQECDSWADTQVWSTKLDGSTCGQDMACHQGVCQPCTADCNSKVCGTDGCGGSCGQCTGPQEYCIDGQCVCVPDCADRECGSDGCAGLCGQCCEGQDCEDGQCRWEHDECDDGNCVDWDGCTKGQITEFAVAPNTSGSQFNVDLQYLADGSFCACWTNTCGIGCSNTAIMLQCFAPDVSPMGPPIAVTPVDSVFHDCGLAGTGDDNLFVLWHYKGELQGTFVAVPEGLTEVGIQSLVFDLGTFHKPPAVTTTASDGFVLAWESGNWQERQLFLQRLADDGSEVDLKSSLPIGPSYPNEETRPALARLNDDRILVVFTLGSESEEGKRWKLAGLILSPEGTPVGEPFSITSPQIGNDYAPSVVATSQGGALLGWTRSWKDGSTDKACSVGMTNILGKELQPVQEGSATVAGCPSDSRFILAGLPSGILFGVVETCPALNAPHVVAFYGEDSATELAGPIQVSSPGDFATDLNSVASHPSGFLVGTERVDDMYAHKAYIHRFDVDGTKVFQ